MKRISSGSTSKGRDSKYDFKAKYIGESSRSAFERGKEHFSGLKDLNYQR